MEHGVEHLGGVLHVLGALAQASGQVVLNARAGLVGLDVLIRQVLAEAHPVAVLLALGAEGGPHADPVVAFLVLHHVAEAIPGRAGEAAVVAHLLGCLVENLLQVGHLLEVHVHLCQVLSAHGPHLVGELAHAFLVVGEAGGRLADEVGQSNESAEAFGGGSHIVGGDDTGVGVGLRGLADGGLEGHALPALGSRALGSELGDDVPSQPGLFILGFVGRNAAIAVVVVVIAAGDESHAQAYGQQGRQHPVCCLYHFNFLIF